MTRRTFEDVRRETIVAERAGALRLARTFCGQVDALLAAGKIGADEAMVLKQRIRAFADGIGTGLHREEADPAGVRAAMREIVRANAAHG